MKLRGDVGATLAKARVILQAGVREARGQPARALRARQGAEKIWLAATTAADALVGPTASAAQVLRAFRRAWGASGEHIAKEVQAALHVGCFYSDSVACDGAFVLHHARDLGRLLASPIRDRQIRARVRR